MKRIGSRDRMGFNKLGLAERDSSATPNGSQGKAPVAGFGPAYPSGDGERVRRGMLTTLNGSGSRYDRDR